MPTRVAAVQMVSSADVKQNLESASVLITEAAQQGAAVVLLPENFAVLEGGPMAQYANTETQTTSIQDFLAEQAITNGVTLVGGTIPLLTRPSKDGITTDSVLDDGRVRPACLVYGPNGECIARYDKIHLFDVLVEDKQARYLESSSFEAGDEVVCIDSDSGRLGLSICYDLRFPELYRKLFHAGAQIVTVPSAFTKVTGQAHWEPLLRARAIENQCYVIAANQGGRHSENRETWGHSMIISPWGEVLSCIESGAGLAIADIDLAELGKLRQKMPIASHCKL